MATLRPQRGSSDNDSSGSTSRTPRNPLSPTRETRTVQPLYLADASKDSIDSLLARLGVTDYTDQQYTAEMNRLELLKEYETRNYNRELQLDQREYDSATSQLQRLMATGMSRQAALGLLGSGGSLGSGSTPYSQTGPITEGVSPSEQRLRNAQTDLAHTQEITSAIQAGASIVGSLTGMANMVMAGISIPATIANNVMQGVAASNMEKASAGMDLAGSFAGALSSSVNLADGQNLQPSETTYQSWQSMKDWALQQPQLCADAQPYNAAVADFVTSPEFKAQENNPYMWQAMRNMYLENTGARGWKELESQSNLYSRILQDRQLKAHFEMNDAEFVSDLREVAKNLANATYQNEIDMSEYETIIAQQEMFQSIDATQLSESTLARDNAQLPIDLRSIDMDALIVENEMNLVLAASTPEQRKMRVETMLNDERTKLAFSRYNLLMENALNRSVQNNAVYRKIAQAQYLLDRTGISSSLREAGSVGLRVGGMVQRGKIAKDAARRAAEASAARKAAKVAFTALPK